MPAVEDEGPGAVQRVVWTRGHAEAPALTQAPSSVFDLGVRTAAALGLQLEPEPEPAPHHQCCATPGHCALQRGWPYHCTRPAAAEGTA